LKVNAGELPELFELAARASINQRYAPSLLHDVRGSMQALFSAIELLSRSARNPGDHERIERACDLARRAIHQHEQTTISTLQLVTQQPSDGSTFDLRLLLAEVARFLHDESAAKEISIAVDVQQEIHVAAERSRLKTLLIGLLGAALDAIPRGSRGVTLPVTLEQSGDEAVIRLGSNAGYASRASHCGTNHADPDPDANADPDPDADADADADAVDHLTAARLARNELTLAFARRFLQAGGGRLEIDAVGTPGGSLQIFYPVAASSRSLAATRASATEK